MKTKITLYLILVAFTIISLNSCGINDTQEKIIEPQSHTLILQPNSNHFVALTN